MGSLIRTPSGPIAQRTFTVALTLFFLSGCSRKDPPAPTETPVQTASYADFDLIEVFPHDPAAFTQGLLSLGGILYESTGLYGESSVRKVELSTGRVLARADLPPQYFGEGLADWSNRLYQLTWKQGRCFVYDAETLELMTEHRYPGEGWGLTQDGQHFILSDGSDTLRFLDPESFSVRKTLRVTRNGQSQANLNELEYISGRILANIWHSDRVVAIDPSTGKVIQEYDMSPLRYRLPLQSRAGVLNGIARHPVHDTLLLTGKKWPCLFEVRLREDDR